LNQRPKITNGFLKLTFTKSRNEFGTASGVAFQDNCKDDWRVKYSAKSRFFFEIWLLFLIRDDIFSNFAPQKNQ